MTTTKQTAYQVGRGHTYLRLTPLSFWIKVLQKLRSCAALRVPVFPLSQIGIGCATMPLMQLREHPRGLDFKAKQRVFALRKGDKKMSFEKIANKVKNRKGKAPSWTACRNAFHQMNSKSYVKKYKYEKCGRKPVLTKSLFAWVLRRLMTLRKDTLCTAATLQMELAKEKDVTVEVSTIRRKLFAEGYKWLRRVQKPKYSKEDRAMRLQFANRILRMSAAELKSLLHMCLDGVVIVMPPTDPLARENFCKSELTHCWRRPDEACNPELHGHDAYSKQAPLGRCIPFWGGIGYGGVAPVLWHDNRKIDQDTWATAVRDGSLLGALRAVNPGKTNGPWWILVDNESFLRAKVVLRAYEQKNIHLVEIAARSPDLNPVEKFWAWLRKQLRAKDLDDLRHQRHVLGRTAYKLRVKSILSTVKAKEVAASCVLGLKKVCKQVKKNKGGASKG